MLRFTIRDLLWLCLVVAFAVGWWVSAHRKQPERVSIEFHPGSLVFTDNETGDHAVLPANTGR